MSEQIDIAVDLGAVPPPLPEILRLRQFAAALPTAPPKIIEGILHQGCEMILGSTSKSNKSWCLLDLALSIASGPFILTLSAWSGEDKAFGAPVRTGRVKGHMLRKIVTQRNRQAVEKEKPA